jgi:hypothetical protein
VPSQINRKFALLILAVGILAAAPSANAGNYNCTVLYPLVPSSEYDIVSFQQGIQTTAEGQTVQTVAPATDNGLDDYTSPVLWTDTGNFVDLSPTDTSIYFGGAALGTDGAQQVGDVMNTTNDGDHAVLWNGTASSMVDLNPNGMNESVAYNTNGTQQVGAGQNSSAGYQAFLWNGTAASAVDLNPTVLTGISTSVAYGTDGTQQVGYGAGTRTGGASNDHAMLWTGTAASAVDLNPTDLKGFSFSTAYAISGNQEVGLAYGSATNNISQAMLWNGTAASAVDLSPTDQGSIGISEALDTNGTDQVGWAQVGENGQECAILWNSSAASALNLNTILPSTGTWIGSQADYIDSYGNIYGYGYGTYGGVSGTFAVEWSVPEPASATMLLSLGAGLLMRRRRTHISAKRSQVSPQ